MSGRNTLATQDRVLSPSFSMSADGGARRRALGHVPWSDVYPNWIERPPSETCGGVSPTPSSWQWRSNACVPSDQQDASQSPRQGPDCSGRRTDTRSGGLGRALRGPHAGGAPPGGLQHRGTPGPSRWLQRPGAGRGRWHDDGPQALRGYGPCRNRAQRRLFRTTGGGPTGHTDNHRGHNADSSLHGHDTDRPATAARPASDGSSAGGVRPLAPHSMAAHHASLGACGLGRGRCRRGSGRESRPVAPLRRYVPRLGRLRAIGSSRW